MAARDAPIPRAGAERRAYACRQACWEALQSPAVTMPAAVGTGLLFWKALAGLGFVASAGAVAAICFATIACGYQYLYKVPRIAREIESQFEEAEREARLSLGETLVRECLAGGFKEGAEKLEKVVKTYRETRTHIAKSFDENGFFNLWSELQKLEQSYDKALQAIERARRHHNAAKSANIAGLKDDLKRAEKLLQSNPNPAQKVGIESVITKTKGLIAGYEKESGLVAQTLGVLDTVVLDMQIANLNSTEIVNSVAFAEFEVASTGEFDEISSIAPAVTDPAQPSETGRESSRTRTKRT